LVAIGLLGACTSDNSGVRSLEASATSDTSPVVTEAPTTTVDTTEPPATDAPPPSLPSDTGDGIGDELFPDLGNPGVDVVDYTVDLAPDPATQVLTGRVTMTIDFTEARSEFTLDSWGPVVSAVTVDGEVAEFTADEPELRITPPQPVAAGDTHTVAVDYTVDVSTSPTLMGFEFGWVTTADGSYVLNEPDGARSWLPSNDHPSDKATWTFRITVPSGTTAVANGALVGTTPGPDGDTWEWREDDPMPTYLILLVTGDYELVESTTPGGLPLMSAVLRDDLAAQQPFIDGIADQLAFFEPLFGPFPLDRYGIAVTDSDPGLAMETQGRSMFSRDDLLTPGGPDEEAVLAHELTHQWFGDAVTPAVWGDIWLNESFATYGEWLWMEHIGWTTVDEEAAVALSARQSGDGEPTGSPTADLFVYNSYNGGAIVLHALRTTIGDDAFFDVLQQWVADNNGTSRTSADFIALSEQVSGQDLGQFFDDWLYADIPPAEYPVVAG
jgi:aminopeptidase N